mmetsp:Transcript_10602/g.24771  ORF Transcript_10602/g.24771 Transcript_10602/m.24771 type:complete len:210 (+) Transcript_10602:54-683(+)
MNRIDFSQQIIQIESYNIKQRWSKTSTTAFAVLFPYFILMQSEVPKKSHRNNPCTDLPVLCRATDPSSIELFYCFKLLHLFFTVDAPQFRFFRTGTVQDVRVALGFQEILGLLAPASPTAVRDQGGVLRHRVGGEGHRVRVAVPHQVQSAGADAVRGVGNRGDGERFLVTGFLVGVGVAHVDDDQVVPGGTDHCGQFVEGRDARFRCHA